MGCLKIKQLTKKIPTKIECCGPNLLIEMTSECLNLPTPKKETISRHMGCRPLVIEPLYRVPFFWDALYVMGQTIIQFQTSFAFHAYILHGPL